MPSVLAILDEENFAPFVERTELGAVLPIDGYATDDDSFAEALSQGGTLYLAILGPDAGEVWLVAVIETPKPSTRQMEDIREPGWYGPVNTTPITDITSLRTRLKVGSLSAGARVLTASMDRAIRKMLDLVDEPVIAAVDVRAKREVKVDPQAPPLARATSYLIVDAIDDAIAAMAEAWRASRAPEIADLIDRATRITPAYYQPLFDKRVSSRTEVEAKKAWDTAFAQGEKLPQLLLNVGVGGEYRDRARKLATLPQDPRIGARFAELLPDMDTPMMLGAVGDLWLAGRDVRLVETLRELEGSSVGRKLRRLLDMTPPELAKDDHAHVLAIETQLHRLEEPLRTECALVDEIAANPDDDGPYLVYADWLLERGRPLGEFISLSCTKQLTGAQARRRELLAEVPYLAGAIDDLPMAKLRPRPRGIDRTVSVNWSTTPRAWQTFAASPLVRAIEKVGLAGYPRPRRESAIADFMRAAPALRTVDGLKNGTYGELELRRGKVIRPGAKRRTASGVN